jgi:hypothetical protein
MKNLSLVLNAILVVAVAILYYMQFSESKSVNEEIVDETLTTELESPIEVEKIQ